jgi:transcription elongation factor Elf1
MSPLFFTCPNTNRRASIVIQTDAQSLRASWRAMLKVNCSRCGGVHEISVRETFINTALFEATDRPRTLL